MKYLNFLALIILSLSLTGCAHLAEPTKTLEDQQLLLDHFNSKLPHHYETFSHVVFKYRFFSLASLGMMSIDLDQDSLAVAGLSPAGMTLFKVITDKGSIRESFAIPEFSKRGDVSKAVAGNIHDIYFNWLPHEVQKYNDLRKKFSLITPNVNGLQWEFFYLKDTGFLDEKRCYKQGHLFWKVLYRDWQENNEGSMYPAKIFFIHHAYGYRLNLKIKSFKPIKKTQGN